MYISIRTYTIYIRTLTNYLLILTYLLHTSVICTTICTIIYLSIHRPSVQNPFLIWQLLDFTKVNWQVVLESFPTIVALTIFSLMHVPINIPSLSMSCHHTVDMNNELMAHGWSNIVSGRDNVCAYVLICFSTYVYCEYIYYCMKCMQCMMHGSIFNLHIYHSLLYMIMYIPFSLYTYIQVCLEVYRTTYATPTRYYTTSAKVEAK